MTLSLRAQRLHVVANMATECSLVKTIAGEIPIGLKMPSPDHGTQTATWRFMVVPFGVGLLVVPAGCRLDNERSQGIPDTLRGPSWQ
jgi:hypothetical protein